MVSTQPKDALIGYLKQVVDNGDLLSSGQKLKKELRQILNISPDILLLDEPTNHLDQSGIRWLESSIARFSGPVLIVSHDRKFLDKIVNKIFELKDGAIKVYGGNYTFYKQQKLAETEARQEAFDRQQNEIRKLELALKAKKQTVEQSNRSMKPTRDGDKFAAFFFANRTGRKFGKQIQALETRIENIEKLDKPQSSSDLKALFRPKLESGKTVVQVRALFYQQIINNLSLVIERNQRIALIGENGSGKTTLLKLILGEFLPDSGEVVLGNNLQVGYLSQEHQELDTQKTVLDELPIDKSESFKLLRRFLIPLEKINQPVKFLSSGEQAKLLLAKIMTSGANFIILDEPTNHLDIPSREAIEDAIANYPGTLLVVSHDRYFLEKIGITKEILLGRV